MCVRSVCVCVCVLERTASSGNRRGHVALAGGGGEAGWWLVARLAGAECARAWWWRVALTGRPFAVLYANWRVAKLSDDDEDKDKDKDKDEHVAR